MGLVKKSISIVLVMLLVATTVFSFSTGSAKAKTTGKVKSIAITKSLNMKVGEKKTLKVSVKTSGNVSKNFTTSLSKKGIVKVSGNSKQVKITALKVGTVKLTVKAKGNKKIKKTVTIKVSAAAVKKPLTPAVTVGVKQVTSTAFAISFSKKVSLTAANVKVEAKQYKTGNYNRTAPIRKVFSEDGLIYYVVLKDYINPFSMVRFTISGVDKTPIVKEIEAEDINRDNSVFVCTGKTGDNIYYNVDLGRINEVGNYKLVKVSGLPTGMTYEMDWGQGGNEIFFRGKIANTGVYKTIVTCQDEKNRQHTRQVVFVIGSDTEIKTFAIDQESYLYSDSVFSSFRDGEVAIYFAGGKDSGGEGYSVIAKQRSPFFDDDNMDVNSYYVTIPYNNITQEGTYVGTYDIKDGDNSTSATASVKVVAKKAVLLSGTVRTNSGKPVSDAEISAHSSRVEAKEYVSYSTSDENGKYYVAVPTGTYDISVYCNGETDYAFNKKITANTVKDFKMDLYQVTMKMSVPNAVGSWFDKQTDDITANSNTLIYLKKGTYDWYFVGSGIVDGNIKKWSAESKFTVNGDTTVNVTVKQEDAVVPILTEGSNDATLSNKQYFKFVPEESGSYSFTTSGNSDTYATLCNSEIEELAYNDDYYGNPNFYIEYDLTGGETYYLEVGYYGSSIDTTIYVTKNEYD
ncbi:MAG: carboxypeptidase-like regulatory domain-containing protein [Lachnospiraceae bacterium]|nr:carboxypeptidase-like regulatory domain-containing protein [Lachnospiraceae bacterium]